MKNRINHYYYIDSFKELQEEKRRLCYDIRLSRTKLELSLLELGATLNPSRLLSSVFSYWMRPVSAGIRQWVINFFKGKGHEHRPSR